MDEFIEEPEKKTPILKKVEVVVVGAGPAGFGAAMAAARNHADTLLVERYGFLGGGFTAQGVTELPVWLLTPNEAYGDKRPVVGGVIHEVIERLDQLGGVIKPLDWLKYKPGGESLWAELDPEMMKWVMLDMLQSAGVKLLLHSIVVSAVVENNKVKGVIVESKSGRHALLADVVVDATGDGDVAASAGAPYEKARGRLLAMTLQSKIANVNMEKAAKDPNLASSSLSEAIQRGELPPAGPKMLTEDPGPGMIGVWPLKIGPWYGRWLRKGEVNIWGPHSPGDCTDVLDLTEAEVSTRTKLLSYVEHLRRRVPGFEDAYLSWTPAQIGLRESRRILGEYFLTGDRDIEEGRTHDDVVVRSRRGDIGFLGVTGLPLLSRENLGPTFDIPYRCLLPLKIDGLLTSGRCISIDHKAATYFAPRDEATCMALGEAAGTAAALSSRKAVKPRDLDIGELQERLRGQGLI